MMAVSTGPLRVSRTVAVQQINSTGNCSDFVDAVGELFPGSVRVARIKTEFHTRVVSDDVPKSSDIVPVASHRPFTASRVFEQDRHFGLEFVECLAPTIDTFGHVAVVAHVTPVNDNS